MAGYISLNQRRKDRRDFCLLFSLAANVKPGPGFRDIETGDIWYQFITREPEAFSDDEVRAIPLEIIRKFSLEAINSAVEAVLKEAEKKDRDIFYYYYRDEMTLKEIGEIVGLSTAAVYKRHVKLENKIRLKLGKDQNDEKK
jgi:RNA polymerase sigma factor (sigma-70 family)